MIALRALVRQAEEREAERRVSDGDQRRDTHMHSRSKSPEVRCGAIVPPPQMVDIREEREGSTGRQNLPEEHHHDSNSALPSNCWLCDRVLKEATATVLPIVSLEASLLIPAPPRAICPQCFSLIYRTVVMPLWVRRHSPDAPSGAFSANTTVTSASLTPVSWMQTSAAVLSAIREMVPHVVSVQMTSAPRCTMCRTSCDVPRHSRDGLPNSLCVDGRPHIRWRCFYCWHQHTRGGNSCERCGRSDGAHRWQCPVCLHGSRGGLPNNTEQHDLLPPNQNVENETTGSEEPQDASSEECSRYSAPARKVPDTDAGGICEHCQSSVPAFIHDCGPVTSAAAPDQGLRLLLDAISADPARDLLVPREGLLTPLTSYADETHTDVFQLFSTVLLGDASLHMKLRAMVADFIAHTRAAYYGQYFFQFALEPHTVWSRVGHEHHRHHPFKPPALSKSRRKVLEKQSKAHHRKYAAEVKKGKREADELCLQAIAQCFGIHIHVVSSEMDRWYTSFCGDWADDNQDSRSQSTEASPARATMRPRQHPSTQQQLHNHRLSAVRYARRWKSVWGQSDAPADTRGLHPLKESILVDERPSLACVPGSFDDAKLHVFLHRVFDNGEDCRYVARPVFSCEQYCVAGSAEEVSRLVAAAVAGISGHLKKEAEIQRRLESRPVVPARAPFSPQRKASPPVVPKLLPSHHPKSAKLKTTDTTPTSGRRTCTGGGNRKVVPPPSLPRRLSSTNHRNGSGQQQPDVPSRDAPGRGSPPPPPRRIPNPSSTRPRAKASAVAARPEAPQRSQQSPPPPPPRHPSHSITELSLPRGERHPPILPPPPHRRHKSVV